MPALEAAAGDDRFDTSPGSMNRKGPRRGNACFEMRSDFACLLGSPRPSSHTRMGIAMPGGCGAGFQGMDAVYQRNKTILITALITMVVTSLVWLGIGAVGYWVVARDSPEFELRVDHPETVLVGEVFKVKVSVKNDGSSDMKLADLDIYDGLLDGFEIVSVTPKPRSTSKVFDILTHEFSQSLSPAETFDIEFQLRATDAGLWGGDIDACTPLLAFVTHYTEIEVLDPAPVESTE